MTDRPTTTIQIKGFPADLWRKVGTEARRRGITIREFVVEAVTLKLGKGDGPSPHTHRRISA